MADLQRPTRVVVVDADDPMSEITGEFFWREDHERLLAQAREAAYRAGFDAGFDDGFTAGASRAGSTVQVVRMRRSRHVLARTVAVMVAIAFLISLLTNFWS